ncbi:DUF1192 domain-containing protein [Oceaniradius stylonematis]|jgi:uncharacterized small protein (DUF1192 family)|uniref:DUF1192 domain-containing protein n=1 Tax=Oceaniradius stylonematis TaxID=2184161 RepID=UPI0035CF8737
MMDDEKQTASTAAHVIGRDIASMSVDELERTIGRLREEIARIEAEIDARAVTRSAADAIFRK